MNVVKILLLSMLVMASVVQAAPLPRDHHGNHVYYHDGRYFYGRKGYYRDYDRPYGVDEVGYKDYYGDYQSPNSVVNRAADTTVGPTANVAGVVSGAHEDRRLRRSNKQAEERGYQQGHSDAYHGE
ncbi:MAG TPA: hypothetical protein VGT41_06880 [Candidatus Babeliales bacterium]|nr:hypothetical protein [Candidatus Babeliales bacterium]